MVAAQAITNKQNLVTKTYCLGVKFRGSRENRRLLEREANQRIKGLQVQQEDIIFDKKARKAAIGIARMLPNKQAKLAVRSIQETTKNYSNIADSAYYWLFLASRGTLEREERISELIKLLKQWQEQVIEWLIFGRSPRIESTLLRSWKVKRLYVINLVHSARRQLDRLCPANLKFNGSNPLLTHLSMEKSIKECYLLKKQEINQSNSSPKAKNFLSKLELISKNIGLVTPYLTAWNNIPQKSRWRSLKELDKLICKELGLHKKKLFSALRTIIIYALSPKIGKTANNLIHSIKPRNCNNLPFMRKRNGRIPIILLMKKDYVVIRPGNAQKMTNLAKTQGFFELGLTLRGHPKINCDLVFNNKVREYLSNGAKIKVLLIKSGPAPGYKINVLVVLEGTSSMFLSHKMIRKFKKQINIQRTNIVALDINRLGKNMFVFSENVGIPQEFLNLASRYKHISSSIIPKMSYSLTNKGKKSDSQGYVKTKGELERLYAKRSNLLKEITRIAPHFIAAVLVKSQSRYLCIEDLSIDPRGTKGALAKAIYSMPDDVGIFKKATELASKILGYNVQLIKVNPRGTSKYHFNCGGIIERGRFSYDISKCEKCGKSINSHINAAMNIQEKGAKSLGLKITPSSHARGTGDIPAKRT